MPQLNVIAYPLILIGTLVHELGHGVAALLVGGNFHSLKVFSNGSGVAQVSHGGGDLSMAVIAAGGLVGPAIGAAILFPLARRIGGARWALFAVGLAFLLALVFFVRNGFGAALTGGLAAACLLIAWKGSPGLAQGTLIFLAVQLALSVFSSWDYLFMEEAHTGAGTHPSDSAQIADALIFPYWFWGAACGAFSIAVLAAGGWLLVRGDSAARRQRREKRARARHRRAGRDRVKAGEVDVDEILAAADRDGR